MCVSESKALDEPERQFAESLTCDSDRLADERNHNAVCYLSVSVSMELAKAESLFIHLVKYVCICYWHVQALMNDIKLLHVSNNSSVCLATELAQKRGVFSIKTHFYFMYISVQSCCLVFMILQEVYTSSVH